MKKWFKLLAAVGLAALTLAGCGNGKDESSDPQAGASPTPPVVQATPQPEQKAKAVKVNAPDGLNIRSKASTDSEILGLAEDGSLLPLLLEEEQDGWYQVEYEGSPAYVSAEFAQVQEITMTEYNALRKGETSTDPAGPPPQAGDTDNSRRPPPRRPRLRRPPPARRKRPAPLSRRASPPAPPRWTRRTGSKLSPARDSTQAAAHFRGPPVVV